MFSTTENPELDKAIKIFLGDVKPEAGCLAIAGPVTRVDSKDTVVLTNQEHKLVYDSDILS